MPPRHGRDCSRRARWLAAHRLCIAFPDLPRAGLLHAAESPLLPPLLHRELSYQVLELQLRCWAISRCLSSSISRFRFGVPILPPLNFPRESGFQRVKAAAFEPRRRQNFPAAVAMFSVLH